MRDDQQEGATPTPSVTPENNGDVTTPEQDTTLTETPEDTSATSPVEEPSTMPTPSEPLTTAEPVVPETPVLPTPSMPEATPSTEAVAPVVATAAVAGGTPAPKKSKKGLFIGLIIAGAAALLIGGSAVAYTFWYQNPDKVVSDAIVNAITAKSVSATGTLEVKTDDYKLKIEASGKSTETSSQVGVKLSYTADSINVTVDGEGIFSSEGDIYVKLNDIKKLAASIEEQSDGQLSFEMFGAAIEKVDNKWVKIGKEDLGDFSEEFEKSQKCFADISKQLEEDKAFRRTVENETQALYKENQFIIVGDSLGSKTINGQGSLGYKLTADAVVADAFFTGLGETELGKKLAACNESIEFDDIVSESAKKEEYSEANAEIWVSRFGHYITEVSIKDTSDGTDGSLVINPTFNKEETITIPTDVVPFADVKAEIEKAYEDYYASYNDSFSDYDSYYDTEPTTSEFN